jgi:hypothetical protein
MELTFTTAVGGAVVLAGIALFTTVSLVRSTSEAANTAYYTPVSLIDHGAAPAPVALAEPQPASQFYRTASLDAAALTSADREIAVAAPAPKADRPVAKPEIALPRRARATETAKAAPEADEAAGKASTARPVKLASKGPDAPAHAAPPVEQWRVIRAANASAFNLGGHIDRSGVVDSLASGHLRDAFKSLASYRKLPQHVRTLIDAANINLAKIAPYRSLLGINDKKLEDEQGVRFERVVSKR